MQKKQTLSIIRHALTFVGGLLVAQGTIDEGAATELTGAVVAIVGTIWGVVEKMRLS